MMQSAPAYSMAAKLLLLSVLSCLLLLPQAANAKSPRPSDDDDAKSRRASDDDEDDTIALPPPDTLIADERALWQAITEHGASVFILTRDIILSADLPPIPHSKVLIVRGRHMDGAPFRIDGLNKYHIFRSAANATVTLRLTNIVLTRALFSAVEIGGVGSVLETTKVGFLNNARAFNLDSVTVTAVNCVFYGHPHTAVHIKSNQLSPESVKFSSCRFVNNQAAPGENGGAMSLLFTNLVVEKCTFDRNTANYGGAVSFDSASGKFTNSHFLNNRAQSGGAISSFDDTYVHVSDTNFFYNVAESVGGGAVSMISSFAGATMDFYRVCFQRNTAVYGGAFLLKGGAAAAKFCSSKFWANSANGTVNNGYGTVAEGSGESVTISPGPVLSGVMLAPGTALIYDPSPC